MSASVSVLRETKIPSIPSTQGVEDPVVAKILDAITEILELREGVGKSDALDMHVRFRDLYRNGITNVGIDGLPYLRLPDFQNVVFLPLPRPDDASTEFIAPPAPTGLSATGAVANVILEWDEPRYNNHAYTEVWRAGADDLGAAAMVGTTDSSVYADNVGATGATYYYWIRFVSTANRDGPFNAVSGTSATTAAVGTGDLADGAVTTVKIADLAVDTAKIADAAVATAKIADASVTTAKIGSAQITTALIADANITTAKIGDAQISTVKIADGAITAAKITVSSLSAITAAIGTLTSGRIQNGGNTNFIDWDASGSISFLKVGSSIDIKANGDATFSGVVISGRTLSVASGTSSSTSGSFAITGGGGLTKLATFEVDTGYEADAWSVTDKGLLGAAGISQGTVTVHYTTTPGSFVARWEVRVLSTYTKVNWTGSSYVTLACELWAEADGDIFQIDFPSCSWKLFALT